MASTNHTQMLARIKLRETEKQRDRLHRHYDSIEQRIAQARDPLERLRVLHEGLRAITFAQKPLHPDVTQLDALFLADHLGTAPPELIADRTRTLERELAQGRLRAEFTYAFGRILSEWTESDRAEEGPPDGTPAPDLLWQEPPSPNLRWLQKVYEANSKVLRPVREEIHKFAHSEALAPVKSEEVQALLAQIRQDVYALPRLRRQAAAVAGNPTQINECAGVLTILLNGLDEWDWPGEGFPLRTVWTRVKYRPYLDSDLITTLFLQLVGQRWSGKLKKHLVWSALNQGQERLFPEEPRSSITRLVAINRIREQTQRFLPVDTYRTGLRNSGYGPDALLKLFETIEREIRFARIREPKMPLHVVQADLRDYYPTLPHEVILAVLAHLGVPESWQGFFGRFLQVKAHYQGEVRTVRRGLVLEHTLADLFGDLVLLFLDLHIYRTAKVPLLRVIDDFWILTPSHAHVRNAWHGIQDFCKACGLEINETKSGAVSIGGDLPAGLPNGRPRWGLLRLQHDATWEIDEPALAQIEETIRQQADRHPSVLGLVSCYNGYLKYILRQSGLSVMLPGDHLRRMGQRLNKLHEGLFGAQHGLVEELHRRLSGCFADDRLKERGLPPALVYWPITAGGLALEHPMLHVATYLRSQPKPSPEQHIPERNLVGAYLHYRKFTLRQRPLQPDEFRLLLKLHPDKDPPGLPTQEERDTYLRKREGNPHFGQPTEEELDDVMALLCEHLYNALVTTLSPVGPPPMPTMEQLVNDFIRRGGEVSGRHQSKLSPYWRWVVYTYGPSLLEALGTFRFLLTELVPLQLILENKGTNTTQSEEQADGGDEMPF